MGHPLPNGQRGVPCTILPLQTVGFANAVHRLARGGPDACRPLACDCHAHGARSLTLANWTTGYCTNVHAGTDLTSIGDNLSRYASRVRDQVCPGEAMGVGLWVPAEAAGELTDPSAAARFRDWLAASGLLPFTFNGFPYGNFHQPIVKHRVYEPAWWQPARREYTADLVRILDSLLPSGRTGSISTLPIGWGDVDDQRQAAAAANLRTIADQLRELEASSGRRIVLAIEPEPGCFLDTSHDVVQFFDRYFPEAEQRRYLSVCHDVCHAEVMFESQADVLRRYADHGIVVGKVQISSAIEVRFAEMPPEQRQAALDQLAAFAEDRYLHQTGRLRQDMSQAWVEDLPQLLGQERVGGDDRQWRIHFHVPIFLEHFGHLHATREAILQCLRALRQTPTELRTDHLEVETYAWSVLPESMRRGGLAESIAAEMAWLHQALREIESDTMEQETKE